MEEKTLEIIEPKNLREFITTKFPLSCESPDTVVDIVARLNFNIMSNGIGGYCIVGFQQNFVYLLCMEGKGICHRDYFRIFEELCKQYNLDGVVLNEVMNPRVKRIVERWGYRDFGTIHIKEFKDGSFF